MTESLNVTWPALRFTSPSCPLQKMSTERALRTSTFDSVKVLNELDALFLVDVTGRIFDLHSLFVKVPTGGMRLLLSRAFNGNIELGFDVSERLQPMDVGQLRRLILKNFSDHKDYWIEIADYESMHDEIMRSDTVRNLIQAL